MERERILLLKSVEDTPFYLKMKMKMRMRMWISGDGEVYAGMDGKMKERGLESEYRKRMFNISSPSLLRHSRDYEPTLLRKITAYNGKEEQEQDFQNLLEERERLTVRLEYLEGLTGDFTTRFSQEAADTSGY